MKKTRSATAEGCIDLDQNGSLCIWYLHLLPPEIILKIMLAYLGNPYDFTLAPPKLKSLNRLCRYLQVTLPQKLMGVPTLPYCGVCHLC